MENVFYGLNQMLGANDFWGMVGVFVILIVVILIE